ncbi:unnamed protein product [Echinostoma caproni]|uniref:ATPase_AAA_core domain-containing protein n=1 Tax=Echinostoma caproni TaxID=27848 RepID=A0A183APD4_9TREM|nr:unnamed protein product [Echinostoma caproni]
MGRRPLRLCILGPPNVGKTTLAKELCKNYRLHHVHMKALIFETYKNLMEPIKALEHLQSMRRAERAAAEATAAAKMRELEADSGLVEGDEAANGVGAVEAEAAAPNTAINVPSESVHAGFGGALDGPGQGTYDTSDYDDYKFTQTAGKSQKNIFHR